MADILTEYIYIEDYCGHLLELTHEELIEECKKNYNDMKKLKQTKISNERAFEKECQKNYTVINVLDSIKSKYEQCLENIHAELEKIEIPERDMFLTAEQAERNEKQYKYIYETKITFPVYRFAYQSDKNYIQNTVTKALSYGNAENFINSKAVYLYGKKVILLEEE